VSLLLGPIDTRRIFDDSDGSDSKPTARRPSSRKVFPYLPVNLDLDSFGPILAIEREEEGAITDKFGNNLIIVCLQFPPYLLYPLTADGHCGALPQGV
jgi:hypothetical protein